MSPLTAVQKCFHRKLYFLRAAHLNQRVVVVAGDKVLTGILYLIVLNLYSLQVLEYDGSTWSEKKERMQIPGYAHAIVAANLPALCSAMGNLNLILKNRQEN